MTILLRTWPRRAAVAWSFCLASLPGAAAEGAKAILGVWRGTSICVNLEAAPACHDEQVVYDIRETSPPAPDKVILKADKIVDGKPVPMGEMEFARDPERGTWSSEFQNERVHALWTFTLEGDALSGTLVLLPDKTLVRKISVRRAAKG